MVKTNGVKSEKPKAGAVPEGFAQLETAGNLEGEWVTPGKGTVIQGRLVKAFLFKGEQGKEQAAYAFRDAEDAVWLISERASYAASMRVLTLGTEVYLRFDSKEELVDKNGRKTGKSMWRTTLGARNAGKGRTVEEILSATKDVLPVADRSNGATEEVPF